MEKLEFAELISICIPVFNGEQYLHESITSSCEQDYERIEIVICDDCSSDSSWQIIQTLALKDSRIRAFRNKQNLGLVGNWNACLKKVKDGWVQFMFQDDFFTSSTSVRKAIKSAQSVGSEIILFDRNYVFSNGIAVTRKTALNFKLPKLSKFIRHGGLKYGHEIICEFLGTFKFQNFMGEPIAGSFKLSVLKNTDLFDERLASLCDFDFWLRLCSNNGWTFLPQPLVNFRVHERSQSSGHIETSVELIDKIYLLKKILLNKDYKLIKSYLKEQHLDEDILYSVKNEIEAAYLLRPDIYNEVITNPWLLNQDISALLPRKSIKLKLKKAINIVLTSLSNR